MKSVDNIRWLELSRYQQEHDTLRCRCHRCRNAWQPRIAASVIVALAMATWLLVAAIVMSLL